MKIYFCKHSNEVEHAAYSLEKKIPGLETEIKSCIHQCSRCKKTLVAKLDGQEIQGRDEKSLVKEVKKIIKKKKKLETKNKSESKAAGKKRTGHEKKSQNNKDSKVKNAKDKKDKETKNQRV